MVVASGFLAELVDHCFKFVGVVGETVSYGGFGLWGFNQRSWGGGFGGFCGLRFVFHGEGILYLFRGNKKHRHGACWCLGQVFRHKIGSVEPERVTGALAYCSLQHSFYQAVVVDSSIFCNNQHLGKAFLPVEAPRSLANRFFIIDTAAREIDNVPVGLLVSS